MTDGGDIIYEPKPLNQISNLQPNNGPINMNNQRIENLSSVPDLSSIDSIIATPNVAVNVSTMSTFTTASLLLNTAYCGPLSDQMGVKGKRVVDMADL